MKELMPFIEIFISIHFLLAVSAVFISGRFFMQKPSLKLRLLRLILLSCLLSPIAVHFIQPAQKPLLAIHIPVDVMELASTKSFKGSIFGNANDASISTTPDSGLKINPAYLYSFILIFLMSGSLYRIILIVKDMRKLKSVLNSAHHYRQQGKIQIKVSDQCVVPFSFKFFRTAYIILPVSILNSSTNTKLAIAHEGQHHRQGDCLWTYLLEGIRIVFWGNPALNRWHRIFNELQELACDEVLVGHQMLSAHDYGRCLFNVAQTASQYSHAHYQKFACTAQMAWGCEKKTESFITRRICMLAKYQKSDSYRKVLGSLVAISAIAILGPLGTAYAAKGMFSQDVALNEIDTSSLDPAIQKIASQEIYAAVVRTHAKSGAIAVADARTGKIIAFAESGNVKGSNSWKSRIFSAASTIKPFVAAAAIDAGVSSESKIYDCREPYDVDGKQFTNGNPRIGKLSITDAMVKSVNICLIKAAEETGSDKFRQTLSKFGFDMNTPWNNSNSDALNLANAALGASVPVTIGSLTKAFTILANKGHLLPDNSGAAVSEATANSVTRMLEKAVSQGTGKRAAIANVAVAGKTGTLDVALFGGYVPADEPRFVSIVVMEDANKGQSLEKASGGAVAAPVFRKVIEKSLAI